jgi:hypothetical protein
MLDLDFRIEGDKHPKRKKAAQCGERLYRVDYASGSAPGFCKTLESATIRAIRYILLHDCSAATISDMISGMDVARLQVDTTRTKIKVISVKSWHGNFMWKG